MTDSTFEIKTEQGRNYLIHDGNIIARCISGDYETRFGGLEGWLKHIEKRTNKRLEKIRSTIVELEIESNDLNYLLECMEDK